MASTNRPNWRLPVDGRAGGNNPRSGYHAAFKAAVKFIPFSAPMCEGTAKSTGKKCGKIALKGTKRCQFHSYARGYADALEAEAERLGRPVIADRSRQRRKEALARLGVSMPWPEGLEKRADLLELGPVARGRLFEAWLNRLTAPDVWEHELRPRSRNVTYVKKR